MSNTVDIQVPQWCVVSTSQFLLSNISSAAFSNTLLGQVSNSVFTVVGSELQLNARTQNAQTRTGSNSPQVVKDVQNNSFNIFYNVYPDAMDVSWGGGTNSAITLNQYSSNGLPLTVQPTLNPCGHVIKNFTYSVSSIVSGYNSSSFPTSLSTGLFSNSEFSPPLLPGLTLSMSGQVGVVIGTPTTLRTVPSTTTQRTTDPTGRTMSNVFTFTVQGPIVTQSNISGFGITNNKLDLCLNYNVPNEFSLSMNPSPTSFAISTIPAGLNYSVVGDILTISGTPSLFLSNPVVATVFNSNLQQSSNTTLTFSFNPAFEISAPTNVEWYSNIQSNFAVSSTTQGISGPIIDWSLNVSGPDTLELIPSGLNATISGTIAGSNTLTLSASVQGTDLSKTVIVNLSAKPDVVTFQQGSGLLSQILYADLPQVSSNNASPNGFFYATAASGQPVTQTADPPDRLGSNSLDLDSTTGLIQGTPPIVSSSTKLVDISASTLQGASAKRTLSQAVLANTVTFDPSQNFPSGGLFIQGRPIADDQTEDQRRFKARDIVSNLANAQEDVNNTLGSRGLLISNDVLVGIPTNTLSSNVLIRAVVGPATGTRSIPFVILRDQLVIEQPTQTDFVIAQGDTASYTITAHTWSGRSISEWSLSQNPTGVSITPTGVLSLAGLSSGSPIEFVLEATTFLGQTLSKACTLTVNSGTFVSPTATSAFLPVGETVAVFTNPTTSLTISSALTGFTFNDTGGNVQSFSNQSGTVYPPELVVFQSDPSLNQPLRVATETVSAFINSTDTNWIQQVNITPITISGSSPIGSRMQFTCPYPPPGLDWNPITRTLTGAPTELTLGNTFTLYATDGNTTTAITVPYRSRVPQQLRGFTSPSAQTQYIRQRAIVNGAVHAVNRNAYLPDPLIATQGGPYPPDVQKPDQACVGGIVQQF